VPAEEVLPVAAAEEEGEAKSPGLRMTMATQLILRMALTEPTRRDQIPEPCRSS